jgi:hypothetical protein
MRHESFATFLIVAVMLVALVAASSWGAGTPVSTFIPSARTSTETVPCENLIPNQTTTSTTGSGNAAQFPGYAALLGNLSSITIDEYGGGLGAGSRNSVKVTVLNESSEDRMRTYLVNVSTTFTGSYVTTESNLGTTTTVTSVNQTTTSWVLAWVAPNGTAIETLRTGGNSTAYTSTFELLSLLSPLVAPDLLFSATSQSQLVNRTTVVIGSTSMYVTNYRFASEVYLISEESCAGQPPSVTTFAISRAEFQVGVVPGTDFTLVTRYYYAGMISEPSGSGASGPYSVVEMVASFTVSSHAT